MKMLTEIYKTIYEKILGVKSKKSINLCCVCLQTIEDDDLRSIHDKAEFILNSGVVVVEKLSQVLKTLIGQDFSDVLPTICQICSNSAMISYSFVLGARESVDVLDKAVQHLELCFADTPKSILQKSNSMYVDINLDVKTSCVIKRHYDKKHNKSLRQAIRRIVKINQYQKPSTSLRMCDKDPFADAGMYHNNEINVEPDNSIGTRLSAQEKSDPVEMETEAEAEPEYVEVEVEFEYGETKSKQAETESKYTEADLKHAEIVSEHAEAKSEHADVKSKPVVEARPDIVQKSLKEATEGKQRHFKYFTCPDCKAGFNSLEYYQRHRLTLRKCITWNRGPFVCDYCNYSVAYKHHLIRHIDFKHKGIGVVCEICGKSFPSNTTLREHLLIHSDEKKFQCKICGTKLKTALSLKNHISTHTGEHNYPCYICGECFRSATGRGNHIKKYHTAQELETYNNDPKHLDKIKKTIQIKKLRSEKEYRNRLANLERDYEVEQNLIDQQENVSKGIIQSQTTKGFKYFNCPDCNAGFNSPELYQKHRSSKRKCTTRKRGYFPCKQCDYSAVYKHWLRHHIQVKHKGKGFVCEECGKVFITQYNLKTHQNTHSDERKFECQFCEKKLKTALSLKNHTTLHTGEKNYPCHICGESFRSASARGNHAMRYHTSKDPLQCEVCLKKFTYKRDFLKHQKRHINDE